MTSAQACQAKTAAQNSVTHGGLTQQCQVFDAFERGKNIKQGGEAGQNE